MTNETQALIGLGGNVGGHEAVIARFRAALAKLGARLPLVRLGASPVYRSEPVGPVANQPSFLNAVIEIVVQDQVAPLQLMTELLAIEAELGRQRQGAMPQGPRTIDMDLLFVGDIVMDEPGPPRLVLPHPRIAERAFVLRPLADLMGMGWRMPGLGRTVRECLADPVVAGQLRTLGTYEESLMSAS